MANLESVQELLATEKEARQIVEQARQGWVLFCFVVGFCFVCWVFFFFFGSSEGMVVLGFCSS